MDRNVLSKRGDMRSLVYLSAVALIVSGCESGPGGGGGQGGGGSSSG